MENPRGDNRLDLDKLRKICSSIFVTNNTQLRFFSGGTGENWHTIKADDVVFSLVKSGLFAVYICAFVPGRPGDNDEHLILTDKISNNIASQMTLFSGFFLHVCILTTELTNKMDLEALNGKTLTVIQGSSPSGPTPTTNSLLCPYVNLLLCNAQPSGEKHANFQHFRRRIILQTNFLEI